MPPGAFRYAHLTNGVESLRMTRRSLPIALLIGADSLIGLPGWRDWRALFGLTHFVVAERPG